MFATDFPHIENEWPNLRRVINKIYADVPEDDKRKIWAGNAVEFFKLPNQSASAPSSRTQGPHRLAHLLVSRYGPCDYSVGAQCLRTNLSTPRSVVNPA